jgi:hypothetical protein
LTLLADGKKEHATYGRLRQVVSGLRQGVPRDAQAPRHVTIHCPGAASDPAQFSYCGTASRPCHKRGVTRTFKAAMPPLPR